MIWLSASAMLTVALCQVRGMRAIGVERAGTTKLLRVRVEEAAAWRCSARRWPGSSG
jgi:hypothetical protein